MKQTVTESMFRDAFKIRPNTFSYAALGELYEWYEQLDEDTGHETELDPIAICCDWAEYTIDELASDYGYLTDEDTSEWDIDAWAEFLNEHTMTIPVQYTNEFAPDMNVDNLLVLSF